MSFNSGQIAAVKITGPQQDDVLTWIVNAQEWTNQDLSSFLKVIHDGSLQGQGNYTNPLGLTVQSNVAGTYNNAQWTLNDRGVTTSITQGQGIVYTDGTTILGNGSSTNVLKVNQALPATVPTADWMTSQITVSGGGTNANIPANALDTNYSNVTPAALNTTTGDFTMPAVSGTVPMWVNAVVEDQSITTGNFIASMQLQYTNSSVTNKAFAWANNVGGQGDSFQVSGYVPLVSGNTVQVVVTTNGTASTSKYVAHVTMVPIPLYAYN